MCSKVREGFCKKPNSGKTLHETQCMSYFKPANKHTYKYFKLNQTDKVKTVLITRKL